MAGEEPATSVTPEGNARDSTRSCRTSCRRRPDFDEARRYLDRASSPKRTLNLIYCTSDPSGGAQIAVAVQAMWAQLGLRIKVRGLELQQFLALGGPPIDASVDVVVIGWIGDFVDDFNFLELFTCTSGNNLSGYCDADYDRLIERAHVDPGRHQPGTRSTRGPRPC